MYLSKQALEEMKAAMIPVWDVYAAKSDDTAKIIKMVKEAAGVK